MSRFEVRFIGGKYEGGHLALPDAGEVGVGRAQEHGICLVEDMVSRNHAKLEIKDGRVFLTDLGSTNGTFVNGERMQECELENDDRVLFGTSILRLVDTTLGQEPLALEPAAREQPTRVAAVQAMSGALSDVSLADLLQLLGGNSRTGVLSVQHGSAQASIVLREGRVLSITADHLPGLGPIKVLGRMLRWQDGPFGFSDAEPDAEQGTADLGRADEALMEATRQNDEADRCYQTLGGAKQAAQVCQPLGGRLTSLKPEGLDTLQLVWDIGGPLPALCDATPNEDSVVLTALHHLVQGGLVRLTPATDASSVA